MRAADKLLLLALAGGAPALALSAGLVATLDVPEPEGALLVTAAAGLWLGGAVALRRGATFRLRTVSNLLAALREGDYSFRVRGGGRDDAFAELVLELNLLAQKLRDERLGDIESTALLGKVMAEIDVAVLAFDPDRRLTLVNRAAARLLGSTESALAGRGVDELGLAECLEGPAAHTVNLALGTGADRWELRRGVFRQGGREHQLLVLSDVSRALRAEEVAAWQRLIRVLGHELRNSLTPIISIARSLDSLLSGAELPADWRADATGGLKVIATRAEALNRLMSSYARLARLPKPRLADVDVAGCVRRVASLETRLALRVNDAPAVQVRADQDQLDQLLINLVRNAVDASLATGGAVTVDWEARGGWVELRVNDEGPGLASDANLFVPFFTTKPGGTGIGLALCRQIAEAHGGNVSLANRPGGRGCTALLRLPLPD
jgi:two-component system, NtrC family, nitrogen regulation sensor histidine kinase NtrY